MDIYHGGKQSLLIYRHIRRQIVEGALACFLTPVLSKVKLPKSANRQHLLDRKNTKIIWTKMPVKISNFLVSNERIKCLLFSNLSFFTWGSSKNRKKRAYVMSAPSTICDDNVIEERLSTSMQSI